MRTPIISIRGAYAYWICARIKTVENRSRRIEPGWYGVHVSGDPQEGAGVTPDQYPLLADLRAMWRGLDRTSHESRFFDEDPDTRVLTIKPEFSDDEWVQRQRAELRRDTAERNLGHPPYATRRIIGMMHVAECRTDSDDPWSEPGMTHWIIDDAYYFPVPVDQVAGKLGVWYYNLDESLIRR